MAIELWSRKQGYIKPAAQPLYAVPGAAEFPSTFRERSWRWVGTLFQSLELHGPMGDTDFDSASTWHRLYEDLLAAYGRPRLYARPTSLATQLTAARGHGSRPELTPEEELHAHVVRCPDIEVIDFISAALQVASSVAIESGNQGQFHTVEMQVDELEQILKEEGIGYRPARGDLLRLDDDFTHEETIAPALRVLATGRFGAADIEFTDALADYRHGDYGDAITKANAAFESTLKILTGRHKGTAGDLIKELRKLPVPPQLVAGADSYFKLMQTVPAIRNEESSAHGRGARAVAADQPLAQFVLSQAAAFISFLAAQQT
jgi:hypothetical protein